MRHINIIGGLLALLILINVLDAFGQDAKDEINTNPRKLNIYASLFSVSNHLGLTVEQIKPTQKNRAFSRTAFLWNIGLGYCLITPFGSGNQLSSYALSVGAGWLISSKKLRNHGDFGFNFNALSLPERELGQQANQAISYIQIYRINFRLGYRFQNPTGGFFIKAGLQVPLVWVEDYSYMNNPAYWQVSSNSDIITAMVSDRGRTNGRTPVIDLGIGWTFKHIKRK